MAQTCDAPAIPNCLRDTAPFEDQAEMKSCQEELAIYRDQVTDFAGCLRDRATLVQDDASTLGQRFRCRAGLQDAC